MLRQFLLILYQTHANLRAEAKRTHGGFVWWFAEPVLHMLIYYLVFAIIFQRGTEDFVPFLLIGLVVWRWFQVSVMQGAMSILNGRRLMQQVYLPKSMFPAVSMLTNSVKFVFTLAILLTFLWFYGMLPSMAYIALPVVLLTQQVLIMGAVYLCASILPFVPDLRIVIDNTLRAFMFLSGIFFAGSMVPQHLQIYFYMNPMAGMIEAYRDILMHDALPNWQHVGYAFTLGLVAMLVGKHLIRRLDYAYPKVMG